MEKTEGTAPTSVERVKEIKQIQRQVNGCTTISESQIDWWEYYVEKEYHVIPAKPDRLPAVKWTVFQSRPPTQAEVSNFKSKKTKWPNIGVVTGKECGLTVIDCDSPEAIAEVESFLPEGFHVPIVHSPKGRHYHFKYTAVLRTTTHSGLSKKIDIRGEGGFAVLPPSKKESGGDYRWDETYNLETTSLESMPQNLILHLELLRMRKNSKQRKTIKLEEGYRDDTIFLTACSMRDRGVVREETLKACLGIAAACTPPFSKEETLKKVDSAYSYKRSGEETSEAAEPGRVETTYLLGAHLTDMGNAERFARQHKENTYYCHQRGKWLHYNGARWAWDNTGEASLKAKETITTIYQEAAQETVQIRRTALEKHAMRSESASKIMAMLSLAKSEPDITILENELDADPWLLNVANGTLDMRTRKLHAHRARDRHTKMAPVVADPQAACPQWEAFLNEIMDGNTSLISFLQRAVGYALTGDTREQCFFLLWGTGANGKTTFLQTIASMLGDYWQQSPTEMLLVGRFGGVPNDIARLKGTRFVSIIEFEEGRRLAESLVKALTGGDTITARFLFHEFFEFIPEFKLFVGTNHKPVIKGTDLAIWRRIRLIPFTISIPEERQDKDLLDKLKEELPGILNWAVEGCRLWQEDGLGTPVEVREATTEYRNESDVLSQFLDERTVQEEGALTMASELYRDYKWWTEDNNEKTITGRAFGRALIERGFDKVRRNTGNHYLNIGLTKSSVSG